VIAFGGLRTGYEWVEQVETDGAGALDGVAQVPSWADENETQYFFVKFPGQVPVAIAPFHVMAEDGMIRTRGRVTDEGDQWLAMRGPDNELFCLRGELAGAEPGLRIRVVGSPAENWSCPGGIPVDVVRVEA
jgi:hypothetical protein